MKISTAAAPLLFAVTILTAGGLAVAQANAADARLTDVGYVNAARCAGLAEGAGFNTTAYDQMIDAQGAGRESLAHVMAEGAREDAARQARAGGYWRARAMSEMNGTCRTMVDAAAGR